MNRLRGSLRSMLGMVGVVGVSMLAVGVARAADETGTESDVGDVKLEEVIVTASRHAIDVEKEARSIDVLTGEDLANQGIAGIQALNSLVPGVQVGVSVNQVQVYIRGIGDRSINAQTNPGVGLNYDGVPLPRGWEAGLLFFDLQRVEVLKGPQGTLYGRNATAGALNVITVAPSSTFGGDVAGQFGNYDGHMFTGAVNVPLNDMVAMRVAFQTNNHNGYLSDGSNDADSQAGRLQFLLTPSEHLSLRLNAAYSHAGGNADGWTTRPSADAHNPWISLSNNAAVEATLSGPPLFYPSFTTHGSQDVTTWIGLARLEWKGPGMTLTVLPGYVDGDMHFQDYPGVIVTDHTSSKQSSLEVRLASSDSGTPLVSGLQWVVGAFGAEERVQESFKNDVGAVFGVSDINFNKLNDRSWAVFTEEKYNLLDSLRVVAGARYTWEQRVADGEIIQYPALALPAGTTAFSGSRDFNKVNYRAGVEYDVTGHLMAYATYSTGFKAGGFYAAPPPDNVYRPENLTAYELGIKSRFFENRLQLNVELFDWLYRDLQQQFIGLLSNGTIGTVIRNAGKSTLRGVDVDLQSVITSRDSAALQIEYNHNRTDDYQFDALNFGTPTGCVVTGAPMTIAHFNCSGFQLVKAPTWSGTASYEHVFPFGNGSSFAFRAEERFSSAYWLANDYIPAEHAPSYSITNLRITYVFVYPKITVSAYCDNVENKPIYTTAAESPGAPGIAEATIDAPRLYGVRMSYRF